MRAFRFDLDAGGLVPCEDMGPVFREVEREKLPPLRALLAAPLPERRVFVGMFAADLRREAARPGGPPEWFSPNASRRKRWAAWSRTSPRARREMASVLFPPYEPPPIRVMVGHLFRDRRGAEALLYLEEGIPPHAEHGAMLDHALRAAGPGQA